MANFSVLVAVLLGIELVLASPIYETSPNDNVEPTTVATTEEIETTTDISVASEASEDLKSAETGVGFIGIGIPIYGGFYPRRRFWGGYGGYGGWGGGWGGGHGGWGHGGWGHNHHHHHHHGHWRG